MQITFELTFDDFAIAQRLHQRRSAWTSLVYFYSHFLSPVLGVCGIACGLLLIGKTSSVQPTVTLLVCGTILIFYPLYCRFRLKRWFRQTRGTGGACTITFSDELISVEGKNSKGTIEWTAVQSFREDDKVFMLYLAPVRFLCFPKRICTEVQIAEIRSILNRHLGRAAH